MCGLWVLNTGIEFIKEPSVNAEGSFVSINLK